MSRTFFYSVLVAVATTIPSFLHAQSFEGEITMQMTSPMLGNQKIDIMYSVKGDHILQVADDPHQGRVTVYTDNKNGVQVIVQEALKQGMEIDQYVVDSAIKKMHLPPMIPKKTGNEQLIAGFKCEEYMMMVDSIEQMNLWLTKDFPKDVAEGIRGCVDAGMKNTGIKSQALLDMFKAGYTPVRFEMKQNGSIQFSNEYLKMERKQLKDAMFVVPSDIKITKFDPSMLGDGPDAGKK